MQEMDHFKSMETSAQKDSNSSACEKIIASETLGYVEKVPQFPLVMKYKRNSL
jgi:hypothetical protein